MGGFANRRLVGFVAPHAAGALPALGVGVWRGAAASDADAGFTGRVLVAWLADGSPVAERYFANPTLPAEQGAGAFASGITGACRPAARAGVEQLAGLLLVAATTGDGFQFGIAGFLTAVLFNDCRFGHYVALFGVLLLARAALAV